jgi:hypothetical protein
VRFYGISEGELTAGRTGLADAFGNTDIAVLYDKNGDGFINSADGAVVGVRSQDTGLEFFPGPGDLDLSTGVRTGVIFYSAGNGTASGDLIFSWK